MSDSIVQRYHSAEQLRRAILMASAQVCQVTVDELLASSSQQARKARKVAYHLARKFAGFDLDTAASMIGISRAQAESIERALRIPSQWRQIETYVSSACHILATTKLDTDAYPGHDTRHSICSTTVLARLAEIQWWLAHCSTILNNVLNIYRVVMQREKRMAILDRLIAGGWGNIPYNKIPDEVKRRAALGLPLPPPPGQPQTATEDQA